MYGHSDEIAATLAKWVAEEREKLEMELAEADDK